MDKRKSGNKRISPNSCYWKFFSRVFKHSPLPRIVEDNKADYYVALRRSQKTIKKENEDITEWLEFFLRILLEQAKQAIDLLSKENIEMLLSPKQLLVWKYLESVIEATPGEISKITKVTRPTVSQALDVLLRLKKVERIGQGRATRYKKL